jgi:putative flippase GtrA
LISDQVNMTNEQTLAAVAGVVLSMLFSYVPGLREWFDALAGTNKRLVMLALLLAVSLATFGLSCAGIIADVSCTQEGAIGLLKLFIVAAVTNQTAYSFSPKPLEFVVNGTFDTEEE